ncbi:RagB/SusD family nutrient uptake outer membrane protein [Aquimarina sp. 2201CG14-23]|uniref:RagB/SusD family nutrient uptake outer membrane protein n=1 Tax=Aquimarina mycalae TaxID=3040073 RepID=UPI002478074F|nr:RagB/SusD family nutrient uptake outer membrane protein [Aquimarina sp. 2201CG14-23]MDH7448386.1 RagB/SusD family nutrient uptake outer membrane protein [Aquimarina sp. 2201CG14-23]
MKNIFKIAIRYTSVVFFLAFVTTSCSIDEVVDPNGPSVGGVLVGASVAQLNELAVGVESTTRNGLGIETTASGTMARELYLFDADPRNTGDLLGKEGITLDNNSFYSTAQWSGSYRCIKNANILIESVNNTTAVSDQEKAGYIGYARTIIAYELIQIVKSYGMARVDVVDPNNLGPVLSTGEVLTFVRSLLDEANTDLGNAGTAFSFTLSSGFDGFDTPTTLSQFNRAVYALAAVYDGDGAGALTALGASYFDLAGDLTTGPKHVFGLGGGDIANPVFRVASVSAAEPNNGDQIIVHDSWINDAEAGDTRVTTKTAVRPDPSIQDGLTGTNETRLYASNVSDIDILRNEELILIYAEASILANNLQDAEDALNVIRNAAGLANYGGLQNAADLTTEMLNQRRYSLWAENHRMFDLRRYGLSNTLPIDRVGDQVFNMLPIPLSENL